MPSPTGGNKEQLFTRVSILTRGELAAYDAEGGLTAPAASGGGTDKLQEMRVAIENLLGEFDLEETQMAKMLALLDEHADLKKIDDSDPNAARARELVAGDDDKHEKLRAFLKTAGLSDADIDRAVELAGSGEAADRMPVNGIAARRQAMDARMRAPTARQVDRFEKKFPGAANIRHW
jgi:hypothetical protein